MGKRSKRKARKSDRRQRGTRPTLAEIPFRELVERDPELSSLRREYAPACPEDRRAAAEMADTQAQLETFLARLTNDSRDVHPAWHHAAAPLAIDPDYAPGMLAVGSLEYQYGRIDEAMALFLQLTTLPAHTEDLPELIDRAGEFLIDQDDIANAKELYAAAVQSFPDVALHHVGVGYCAAHLGQIEESIERHRRAVELEPDNYKHVTDLGYSLLLGNAFDEAETVLQRAVRLAPPDYELARGNLEHLRKIRSERP